MFLYLMDIYAWIFVIAIGATVLLLAFYGLARVLYAVAPVIGALYLLAFIYGILAIIYGMVCKWCEVAVPVLFFVVLFAVLFAAYKYFRRKPALPLPKADMPVNSRASTSSADQRSSSGRGYQRHAASAVSSWACLVFNRIFALM